MGAKSVIHAEVDIQEIRPLGPQRASEAVARTIAAHSQQTPEEVEGILSEVVDTDALDAVFSDQAGYERVLFRYGNYNIEVDNTGGVTITPLGRISSDEPSPSPSPSTEDNLPQVSTQFEPPALIRTPTIEDDREDPTAAIDDPHEEEPINGRSVDPSGVNDRIASHDPTDDGEQNGFDARSGAVERSVESYAFITGEDEKLASHALFFLPAVATLIVLAGFSAVHGIFTGYTPTIVLATTILGVAVVLAYRASAALHDAPSPIEFEITGGERDG